MFLDSELEIYYDLLKNDKIVLQCTVYPPVEQDTQGGIGTIMNN
jgi:hypothetical protein